MCLYHYQYFTLTRSVIVSDQIYDVLESVKRLSKALTKFHGKIISILSAGASSKMVDTRTF